jgi:hypothetical protein
MNSPSPIARAILARLDRALPEGPEPEPGEYGHAAIAYSIEVGGRPLEDGVLAFDSVKVGAPTIAAPTAAALTLAGVARMLDAITHGAGAVAPHVRARALRALFDGNAPADAATLAEVEAVRAAARAELPAVPRAGAVKLRPAALPFRRV